MSERGDALLKVVGDAARNQGLAVLGYRSAETECWAEIEWDMDTGKYAPLPQITHTICKHLGVTWEDVAMLREMAQKFNVGADNHEVTGPLAVWADQKAEALATLLEAAGTPRDGDAS